MPPVPCLLLLTCAIPRRPTPTPPAQVNDGVRDKLEQLDRPDSAGGSGPGGEVAHQQLGASLAADAALQRQLAAQTPKAFSAATLDQARSIIAACRRKLAESTGEPAAGAPATGPATQASQAPDAAGGTADAAAAGTPGEQAGGEGGASAASPATQQQQQQEQDYWDSQSGRRLGSLIEGCVHSLVLLQQGAASAALPGPTLAAALDAALQTVRPQSQSAASQQLWAEIEEAMRSLKLHIISAA